ncbi:hypothetical protein Pta02_13560 [Planobispora takensis]|uniref:Uncharacterized protein n=1 Tax=Planobispora takensis TaxID=1367882 RepID=A0A8J3WSK0_9ACTN|nr:hypothetical protein Pta02_13560 [Planobispora takensis]
MEAHEPPNDVGLPEVTAQPVPRDQDQSPNEVADGEEEGNTWAEAACRFAGVVQEALGSTSRTIRLCALIATAIATWLLLR